MAKQLNVNVAVTADTGAAKAQLQSLQQTLQQLTMNSANLKVGLDASALREASTAADQLAIHLKNATNANTGLLDFSKLSASIKASGSSLTDYGNQLLKLGPQGQQAFSQLTQAIAKSEVPVNRLKSALGEFGTVLSNTIKWQAASSAIHGMMGSIQHAFSYAQQLNESLNRIQIVTQASNEQMAQFAENANKAAQRLSTTTTQYTNASLIYYQQGLSDKEVAARTETTIKMANASGQSAEKVSNQMTAIWNNFDDGTKSLEYYADVITALGAATASSSEEIATGLQKFASVADTVGLSYENATAALATITAETRQSADSVGTGLRTLFARLQSLNLGETLEDGVTLTKYSKALDTIGVKVLDAAGNMRQMDDILADMGAKWDTLTDAQKTATAQTVGGVRQYTTIMALMENFDKYQENLKIAQGSSGTVQAQADIYAKSWEAAQKRVKAASESLYSDLIDDQFFISLNNGFASFLNLLDQIIDGFGGLKTLLPGIIGLITNLFSDQISSGMVKFTTTLSMLMPGASRRYETERQNFLQNAASTMAGIKNGVTATESQKVQLGFAEKEINFQQQYIANQAVMSQNEKQLAQMTMDRYSNLRQQYQQTQQAAYTSQANARNLRGTMVGSLDYYDGTNYNDIMNDQKASTKFTTMEKKRQDAGLSSASSTWFDSNNNFSRDKWLEDFNNSGAIDKFTDQLDVIESKKNIIKELFENGTDGLTELMDEWDEKVGDDGFKDLVEGLTNDETGELDRTAVDDYLAGLTQDQTIAIQDFATQWGLNENAVKQYSQAIIEANGNEEKLAQIARQIAQTEEQATAAVNKRNRAIQTAQTITKFASAIGSGIATMNSFAAATENIVTNIENGDSVFTNFGSTLSGVSSGLMSMAMTIAAFPSPVGIAIAVISTLIGVLSQIPEVKDAFHNLITSEDQLKLEQAQKAAELIQTEFEEAKQKAEEFLDATSTHNGLLDKINQCTQGTEEFKQAIIEANAYAKQMMQDFSLSIDDFERLENGALVLKDGVAESRQKALEAQRDNLEIMSAYADYAVQKQKYENAENKIGSLMGHQLGVYANGKTKEDHEWIEGYEGVSLKQFLEDYDNYGGNSSFEDYYKSRGGLTGSFTEYGKFNKAVHDLGYKSIDEFIQAGKDYGSASSIKFDGIVSDLFENIATAKVFNEDYDVDVSSFLTDHLGTSKNGDLIQNASLEDWLKQEENQEISNALVETMKEKGIDFGSLSLHSDVFLKEFLKAASDFDDLEIEKMTSEDLQKNTQAFLSAQKGIKIFEDNYKALTEDSRVKLLADIGKKSQVEQSEIIKDTQSLVDEFNAREAAGEELTEQEKLIRDYYNNQVKEIEDARDQVAQRAMELFANDKEYQTDDGKDDIEKQDELKTELKDFIANSSLTNAEVAETLNLGSQIKNVLGEAFNKDQFKDLFTESDITSLYKSIDWSSQVSAFFDITALKERIGNAGTEISQEINNLYETLLDENHLNGESGLFSQIFQEEEFQKNLKDVQKEFKRTGSISSDSVEEIANSCEHLNDALDNGIYSAEAVADALELYSSGAISNIDEITNGLWRALEAANGFKEVLQDAFDYIDSWDPDRSVSDLSNHFINTHKDYASELGTGNFGGERVYQDAAEIWGKEYSRGLRSFLIESQRRNADTPENINEEYQNKYQMYDAAYKEAEETGNMGPVWSLITNSAYNKQNEEILGYNAETFADIGITRGANGNDIEVDTKGRTSKEFTNDLATAMGLTYDQAAVWAAEMMGHDATVAQDFQTRDFTAGLEAANKAEEEGEVGARDKYLRSQANDVDYDLMLESINRQIEEAKAKGEDYKALTEQKDELEAIKKDLKDINDETEKQNQNADSTTQKWENLSDYTKDVVKQIADSNQLVTESGKTVSDIDPVIDKLDDLNVTGEEAQKTLEELGLGAGTIGKQYTDEFGEVQTAVMDSDETVEQFLNRVNNLESTAANKKLGRELFEGITDGLKDLIDSGENLEGFESLLEPLKGLENLNAANLSEIANALTTLTSSISEIDTSNLSDLTSKLQELQNFQQTEVSLETSTSPSATDIEHLKGDFTDIKGMEKITVDIRFGDESAFDKIKEDKGELESLKEAASINVTFVVPDTSTVVSQIQAVVDQITEQIKPEIPIKFTQVDENGNQLGSQSFDGTGKSTDSSMFGSAGCTGMCSCCAQASECKDEKFNKDDTPQKIDFSDNAKKQLEEGIQESTSNVGTNDNIINRFGDNQETAVKSDNTTDNNSISPEPMPNTQDIYNQIAKEQTVTISTDSINAIGDQVGNAITDNSNNDKPSSSNKEEPAPQTKSSDTSTQESVSVEAEAKFTSYNAESIEPVPITAETEIEDLENSDMDVSLTPDDSELQATLDEQGTKDVFLNNQPEQVEQYIHTPGSKIVDLLVGKNEPAEAIAALPSSHALAITVTVSVTGSNAFGGSVSFAGGGDVLGSQLGAEIDELAIHYAINHPKMQEFIKETEEHYKNDENGNGYSKNKNNTQASASGGNIYRSYVNGSANRRARAGISLTAEEGPEIVWNKQEGYAYIVGGDGHPEFANLRPGDRIFNANDTRQILNYHRPKSNAYSQVKDPREMSDSLFSSHVYGGNIDASGSSSKKGSGGGGSGSGSASTKTFYPERYHLTTRQIADLTFWYDELSKAKDKAYGTNRLRYIQKEIDATDELINANKQLLKEAEDWLAYDLQRMDELGIAYELDENGNLKNYDELQETYKKIIDTVDDETLTDAAQKAWDAIEQYEETLDKIHDVKSELSDQIYEQADLRLEKISLKAELRVDFDDKEIDFLQHFIDKLSDNIYETSNMLGKMGSQMDLINDKIDTTHTAIDEVFGGMTDAYGNKLNITYQQWLKMSEAERDALNINGDYGEQLEDYAKDLQDYIEALQDYKTKGVEALTAAFEELNTKVTDQVSLFDHYSSMLSSLRDITDLQGIRLPKDFRDTVTKLNRTMLDTSKNRIASQKAYYDELNKEANDLQNKINRTSDYDLKKMYQEQLDDIKGLMRDTMEDVLETYQNSLDRAQQMFEESMAWIKADYEASLSDMYNSTSLLQDAFDRKKALTEQYVDDYEKYYQLGKLQRQINKDIDTAAMNGNKTNKNLKKLLEEIQALQESGAELSAYDLDILEKKYEYEKALADLEDARDAKQIVRLQRDRNGNWGYVYTAANGDELADQEQAVEDKLYEYTKTATEQSKNLQGQILSLWSEAGDKIAQMRADGVSEDVIDDYILDTQNKLDFLMAQLEKTGTDVSFYLPKWVSLTNENFNLTTDNFKETVLSLVTGLDSIGGVGDKVSEAIRNIADATKDAVDQYELIIDELNKFVSGNSNFTKNIKEWAKAIDDASRANVNNTKTAVSEMGKVFTKVLNAANEFEKKFMATYEPIIKRNEEFLQGLLDALDALNKKTYNAADTTPSDVVAKPSVGSASNVGASGKQKDDKIRFLNFYYGGSLGDWYEAGLLDEGVMAWCDDTYEYYKQLEGVYGAPNAYDTGGYTGDWGTSDGKLAILHEKEQVFNKEDTANLLSAANILKTLDMQTSNFEKGLGNFNSPNIKENKQTIEQEVNITAEFPNATNHSEIEEAFNNLANRATQYANRKVG